MSSRDAYRAEMDKLLQGFAENLRRLRHAKERGYSQEDLCLDARLHRTAVGKLEVGRSEPYLSTLLILADTLGVTLDELVEGLPVPQERRPSARSERRQARRPQA